MIFRLASFALVGLISGTISWWAVDRDPPVTILSGTPENPIVAPGEYLRIKFDIVRHDTCYTEVYRYIVDSGQAQIALTPEIFNVIPGKEGRVTSVVPVLIPRAFPPGKAQYLSVRKYQCNPVQWLWPITVISPPIDFEVKGPPVPLPVEIR